MLCQNCGENEANVRYTQIINGVKKQVNLCEKCAKELGIGSFQFNMPIHFSDFLGDFFGDYDTELLPNFVKESNNKCNSCEESYDEFIKTGLLGCPECYDIFEDRLDPILKKLQGNSRHVGRGLNERLEKSSIKKAEIEEQGKRVQELQDEIKQKQEKRNNLKQNKEKFEKELKEKEEELEKITKTLSDKELEIEGYKAKVEQNTDKKYELQSEINTQDINYRNDEKRQRQVKNEISSHISELDSARLDKDEISKQFYEIDSKRNKIVKLLEEASSKKQETDKKIKSYDSSINTYMSEMRIKESKLKFLIETEKEKEGYIKSVKSLLKDCESIKELGKGMHGVLANIIEVPEEYQTAIEMCLGASLQNIVTDTEDDAKRLVEHLRKNNLGRASFLPITSVRGKKLDKVKGNEKGYIGIASDLIEFNKKYEQIILNLLGRTVIVDNMDTAIKVAKQNGYSFRIITVEGDVINPSGAITGGSVAKKTVNILGRGREIEKLEKDIQDLKSKVQKLQKEKEDYENGVEDILEETSSLEKELQEIDITYATEKQKVIAIDENISKIENRLNKLKEEDAKLENQKQDAILNKNNLQKEIEKLTEDTEKFSKIISEFADLNKDNQKYVDDLNFDITNLKISVSSFDESESSIEEIQERINLEIANNNKSIENKKMQIEQIVGENFNLEQTIEEIKMKIEKIKEDVKNSGSKIEELKQERTSKNEKLSKQEEEITSKFAVIEDLKAQIVKIDVKKTKLEEDINSIINKMWEEYELTPNNAGEYKRPDNVTLTQKKVNNLRADIRDLGSVNVDSIEEYKTMKERYDFMCEQRVDLEETMSKLRKIISEMTATMKEQFRTQFKIINKNFGEVFKELFGGGNATLKLEDEENILECGIDITVQPPGKKLQNMMLLSGGEKAFTAIALLFAILKINPAPFCVLDEIEAALDDVNVFRFAEYLKKFSSNTQFLVITHRKGTMEAADTVYGVTMEESGISKLLSMKLANG